jgi:hypothetical protein
LEQANHLGKSYDLARPLAFTISLELAPTQSLND